MGFQTPLLLEQNTEFIQFELEQTKEVGLIFKSGIFAYFHNTAPSSSTVHSAKSLQEQRQIQKAPSAP